MASTNSTLEDANQFLNGLTKASQILENLQEQFPDVTIIPTESFLRDVINSVGEPHQTFEEQIKEVCNENIMNKTIKICEKDCKPIKMTVTLDKANYGNYLYYRIICDKACNNTHEFHPFMRVIEKDQKDLTELGEVVADNEMIRKMFEFLVMPDEELEKHCGNATTMCYRAIIIASIGRFWD